MAFHVSNLDKREVSMLLLYCLIMSALWGYILGNLAWYAYEKHLNGENFLIELGQFVSYPIEKLLRIKKGR